MTLTALSVTDAFAPPADLANLKILIDAAAAEPLLVLAAGGDALEAVETAEAFNRIGVQRMIVTNPGKDELMAYVKQHEIPMLFDDGLERVLQQHTTVEEISRVISVHGG